MAKPKSTRREVQNMFRTQLGSPPPPEAARGTLAARGPGEPKARSDRVEQMNLRVPVSFKRRVRMLATRDDISLSEVVIRAVELYEKKYGAAPEL